jgi:hypothetical protein
LIGLTKVFDHFERIAADRTCGAEDGDALFQSG